jgi:hypothetical protein
LADPGVTLKISSDAILSGIRDLVKASTSRVDDSLKATTPVKI